MSLECPLCINKNTSLFENIHTDELIKTYWKILNINISNEFRGLKEIDFFHCPLCDLRFFSPRIPPSESFYEKLQKFEWYYLDDKDEYVYASRYVNNSSSVLEVGAGKGAFSRKISTAKYTGLEYNRKAVDSASSHGIDMRMQSIKEHAAGNRETYDVVCAFQVLEHVVDIRSFISNCISCLRPGGILIFSVPSADSFVSLIKNYILNMPPHHQTWWSEKCLRSMGDLFELEVSAIYQEKLSDIHRKLYASTLIFESLRNLFGMKMPMIDLTAKCRLMTSIASIGSILLEKGLSDCRMRPAGHTLTAVLKKPIGKSHKCHA